MSVSQIVMLVIAGLFSLIIIIWVWSFAGKAYSRYQDRLDANNQVIVNKQLLEVAIQNANNEVLVNEIRIKQQEQLIQVEKQKAEIRVVDAEGIARAQHIINATLTDKYLQHEAIDAQKEMAKSPNHTTIYIPSGQNGIPVVKTTD